MTLRNYFSRKLEVISLSLMITIICYVMYEMSKDYTVPKKCLPIKPTNSTQCYTMKDQSLPDITDLSEPEMKENSIFFHETTCNSHFEKKLFIHPRQACAVESAAKLHPDRDVYLLFNSPGVFKNEGCESDRILQALMSYDNIKLRHLDIEKYTNGTPVEDLFKNGKIQASRYPQSHFSDVLRYLTLWKYGGIYLDLDVVMMKSLDDLPPNYAGAESDENVASGVVSFSKSDEGHELATKCLNDLRMNFKGDDWSYNGPGVITRLSREICKKEYVKAMFLEDCDGFRVYPPNYFYPIHWHHWSMYFDEIHTEVALKLSESSYLIHMWNKLSVDKKISVHSKTAYTLIAQEYCPNVFNECDIFF